MRLNFKDRLRDARPLIGTLITTASQACAEVLANSGYDWLFIDAEHGAISLPEVSSVLRSAGGGPYVLARLPNHDSASFKQALDAGVDGVIVPLVNCADDARKAVRLAKYPPLGERSVGIGRAQGYGFDFAEYVSSANDRVTLIVQIEHIQAIENLAEILLVPGIDGVFIGPYDLSGSMGLLGDVKNARVGETIDSIRRACRERQMPFGIFAMHPEVAIDEIKRGSKFVAIGTDMFLLGSIARRAVSSVREAINIKT